jgi:hypothetical protein
MGFSQIALMYVSGLAQKVTLPEEKFDVTPVQLGAVSFPFPKGTVLQNLSVEFLDDEISSVYRFHRMWMGMVSGSGGMVFTELGKVCLSALFMPIKRYPAFGGLSSPGTSYGVGLDAPVGAERFPHLFPVSVSRSAYDRSGSSVIKTSVTYVRVPDMSNVLYHKYPGKAKDTIW